MAELRLKNNVKISGTVSSQFISALLMYAPTLKQRVTIQVIGKLVSAPYVQMTIDIMKRYGVTVKQQGARLIIQPQHYKATEYKVEGDASSATYWWALAAISSSHITVDNIPADTLQPDARFKAVLAKMGCTVRGNTVIGPWERSLQPVTVNMSDYPDAVMSAAIAMSQAHGKSTITGIEHLAHKETDRLALLKLNLRKLGISARTTKSSITITGRNQKLWQTNIKTGDDHRFAMAFSLLNMSVDNKRCVQKSYPTFWQDLKRLQQQSKNQTIVLTGMRGVGKTTYGKQLAKRFKAKCIDTDQSLTFRGDWRQFRDQEHVVVKRVAQTTNTIISTGGGTLMYPRNFKLLKQHYIVLLTAPLSILKKRLSKQTHRPALTKGKTVTQELAAVWKERQPTYLAVADNVYDCR
jgi:shikimate kinase